MGLENSKSTPIGILNGHFMNKNDLNETTFLLKIPNSARSLKINL